MALIVIMGKYNVWENITAISDQAPCLGKCHALANVMFGKLSWRVNMTVGRYPVLENTLFGKLSWRVNMTVGKYPVLENILFVHIPYRVWANIKFERISSLANRTFKKSQSHFVLNLSKRKIRREKIPQ
jgi:hypothetical protein